MKYILLLISILLVPKLYGQVEVLPAQHVAYKHCNKIYQQLKKAIGDQRTTLPKLLILNREKRVAAYREMDNSIIIEKKAYDICQSMGVQAESALAFLIGHELTHFYQQTDWKRNSRTTHFL
ncbi:MAG: hypothetical protein ACI976_002314, partial [Aureispira sp.]